VSGPYHSQTLVEAPLGEVWDVVSNPQTHPDWWPEVFEVRQGGGLHEGDTYVRMARVAVVGKMEAVWVVERMVDLKEAHFRCTRSGSYARFALTPAGDATFVDAEAGMLPKNIRYRLLRTAVGSPYYRRWLRQALDALPKVVRARRAAG
jgi:Polyketide cyclase / dehydrase and lipid transport